MTSPDYARKLTFTRLRTGQNGLRVSNLQPAYRILTLEKTSSYPWKLASKSSQKTERRQKASDTLGDCWACQEEKSIDRNASVAGEQQRVAIARALANDPAIILADEPPGGLGPPDEQGVVELLANLDVTRGTAIIMVAHDSEAAKPAPQNECCFSKIEKS